MGGHLSKGKRRHLVKLRQELIHQLSDEEREGMNALIELLTTRQDDGVGTGLNETLWLDAGALSSYLKQSFPGNVGQGVLSFMKRLDKARPELEDCRTEDEISILSLITLYIHSVKGTMEELALVILGVFEDQYDGSESQAFLNELSSFVFESFTTSDASCKTSKEAARSLLDYMPFLRNVCLSEATLQPMLEKHSILAQCFKSAFSYGLLRNALVKVTWTKPWQSGLQIPALKRFKQSILRPSDVWLLQQAVPEPCRETWQLVYTSKFDGKSWHQFSSKICNIGSTLLVLKDATGNLNPSFNTYATTGYNENYMYLNQGAKTLPNGLGMGGQLDYFGLSIHGDFDMGSCKGEPVCTTFHNPPLSGSTEFKLDVVEVWLVLPAEEDDVDGTAGKPSALAANKEAMALLEMNNRPTYAHVYEDDLDPDMKDEA